MADGYRVWDRVTYKSWWWKRWQYNNRLWDAEGLPRKTLITGLSENIQG